jgi:hypothetical protein
MNNELVPQSEVDSPTPVSRGSLARPAMLVMLAGMRAAPPECGMVRSGGAP